MQTIQPPTSRLPPIAKIALTPTAQLSESLHYLHSLYRPQVRGSRRRRRDRDESLLCLASSPDNNDGDNVQRIRSDAFERAYAIRWLTALIAQLEARHEPPSSLTAAPTPTPDDVGILQPRPSSFDLPIDDTDAVIQQAASLLATCAGVAAAGKLHRRFSFDSPLPASAAPSAQSQPQDNPSVTVHVDLTDIPLNNHDYASVGAQTWGGACVLAEMIAERPDQFGLGSLTGVSCSSSPRDGTDTDRLGTRARPLRVLELGAGTGLVGLTVAKVLQALFKLVPSETLNPTLHPRAIIVLTDFYPTVLVNLQSNIDANFPTNDTDYPIPPAPIPPVLVCSHPLDWSVFSPNPGPTTETPPRSDILSAPFDLVFGADIVYEAQHAVWIRDCLTSLLSYPDDLYEDPIFHLVIPLRPTHTFESGKVEEVFGSKDRVSERSQRQLTILSRETVVCEAHGDGRFGRSRTDDDVEYVYYRIGWTR